MKLNKKDYIDAIKQIEIDSGDINKHKDSDKIEINVVGRQMQKLSNQISLKSIYDLVVNKFEFIEKDISQLRNDVNEIKQEITQLKIDNKEIKQDITQLKGNVNEIKQEITQLKDDVKKLKSLPTIAKELENN